MPKSPAYQELEKKVFQNLMNSGLRDKIVAKSAHAMEQEDYSWAEIYNDFSFSQQTGWGMFIKANIRYREGVQPVTPKIYRLTEDKDEQIELSNKIWESISEEDIKNIALETAGEYFREEFAMSLSEKIAIKEFYPAIQSGNVSVVQVPDFAQYKVVRNR